MHRNTEHDPIQIFEEWLQEAERQELKDFNAMALATVDPQGMPSVRMVLLKEFDRNGFVFYTNLDSRKGRDLQVNRKAALCFYWGSLKRQVRVQGEVERLSDSKVDAYFASRSRGSKIGAWASLQSREMEDRWTLERQVTSYTLKFGLNSIPRPPSWGGFRLFPETIEFWSEKLFRLHERIVYRRSADSWTIHYLFP